MIPAADITLTWNGEVFAGDVIVANGDLMRGDDLATAVIASLFTWRRARPDDVLPDYVTTRMGWWGDTYLPNEGDKFGSRLWLLRREKLLPSVIGKVVEICQEALEWLIEDRVASRVEIIPERNGTDRLDITVIVYQADGSRRSMRFSGVWQAIQQGGVYGR